MANQGSAERVRRGSMWRVAGWGTALGLVLAPLAAMQFTTEVNWTASDFLFATVVFGSVGVGIELAARIKSRTFMIGVAVALLASLLQIWFTAAVGIIGNENEGSNLLFPGVVLIALTGSAIARFRPARMAVAMIVAAVAQAAVPVIASVVGDSSMAAIWAPEVIVLTIVLTALWLVSARLFQVAARSA